MPLPVPLVAPVRVIQGLTVLAFQLQPGWVLTLKLMVPPSAGKGQLGGFRL